MGRAGPDYTRQQMRLTHELLLPYQGLNGFDGLCHIRVYEEPGKLPVAIAGGLTDSPGTTITNAIEMVAAAIQRSVFTDGREFFLVEHYPSSLAVRDQPTFAIIHFSHRSIHEDPDNPRHYAGNIAIFGTRAPPRHAARRSRATSANPAGRRSTTSRRSSAARSRPGPRLNTPRAPSPASGASSYAADLLSRHTAGVRRSLRRSKETSEHNPGSSHARLGSCAVVVAAT